MPVHQLQLTQLQHAYFPPDNQLHTSLYAPHGRLAVDSPLCKISG